VAGSVTVVLVLTVALDAISRFRVVKPLGVWDRPAAGEHRGSGFDGGQLPLSPATGRSILGWRTGPGDRVRAFLALFPATICPATG
jgi:hypothetical protein